MFPDPTPHRHELGRHIKTPGCRKIFDSRVDHGPFCFQGSGNCLFQFLLSGASEILQICPLCFNIQRMFQMHDASSDDETMSQGSTRPCPQMLSMKGAERSWLCWKEFFSSLQFPSGQATSGMYLDSWREETLDEHGTGKALTMSIDR